MEIDDQFVNITERSGIAVLGVLLRVEQSLREQVSEQLASLPGVEFFPVDDPLRMGVVIEAATTTEAEFIYHEQVQAVEGVLGAWPVFAHAESEETH